MKDQLIKLYQDRHIDIKAIRNQFPDDDMAGPLLISPNKEYSKQKIPLLIIGQETYGWDYHIDDVEKQMAVYEGFNLGEKYYSSPFWNVTRKVEKVLGNTPYSCSWTNISKYDVDGGRSSGEYEKAISTLDDILIDEIRILKPKVCLFFTGPAFDYRIKNIFPGVKFLEIPKWPFRQFCRLNTLVFQNLLFDHTTQNRLG